MKILQLWQYGPPSMPETTFQQTIETAVAHGWTALAPKALDGRDWMALYDGHADALGSVNEAAQQRQQAHDHGLAYFPWTNPLYTDDLDLQATLTAALANVSDGLVLDLEPYQKFWGPWRPEGDAQRFMEAIRELAPDALLIFQPDPRPARLAELRPQEWIPFCDVLSGQHYWTDFSSDPAAELEAARQLGLDWNKTPWPTLPLNSSAELITVDVSAEIARFTGLIGWRLGSHHPSTLALIGALQLDTPQPATGQHLPTYDALQTIRGHLTGPVADALETTTTNLRAIAARRGFRWRPEVLEEAQETENVLNELRAHAP